MDAGPGTGGFVVVRIDFAFLVAGPAAPTSDIADEGNLIGELVSVLLFEVACFPGSLAYRGNKFDRIMRTGGRIWRERRTDLRASDTDRTRF
jgi:hypothetical protein